MRASITTRRHRHRQPEPSAPRPRPPQHARDSVYCTTTASASPVLGFISLNKGVGSQCIPIPVVRTRSQDGDVSGPGTSRSPTSVQRTRSRMMAMCPRHADSIGRGTVHVLHRCMQYYYIYVRIGILFTDCTVYSVHSTAPGRFTFTILDSR